MLENTLWASYLILQLLLGLFVLFAYFQDQGNLQSDDQLCSIKCCESSPCQNGGVCHELCGQKKRLQCKCAAGFTGEVCNIKAKSCLDHFKYNRSSAAGFYDIQDDSGTAFTVFCDFDVSVKFAWTLVMSYKLANNAAQFKTHPLYKDHPVSESQPNWDAYRVSKARMIYLQSQSFHWRATCSYNTDVVVLTDYMRATFDKVNPITLNVPACNKMEYDNIRGKGCDDCTIWCHQSDTQTFLIGNWYGQYGAGKCEFVNAAGTVTNEHSFGYYGIANNGHRCAAGALSTTQYWFGSSVCY